MHPSRSLGTPSNCVHMVWDFGVPYHVMIGESSFPSWPVFVQLQNWLLTESIFPLRKDLYLHSRSGKRYSLLALCLILEVGFVCAWQGQVLARYLSIAVVSKPLPLLRLYDTKDLFNGILLGEYWDRSTQLCTVLQYEGMKRINRSQNI